MITPMFWITQDEQFLHIRIRAPYAKIGEFELDYGGFTFFFSCQPYFLRLHLKNELEEFAMGLGSASFDSDEGEFLVDVPKKVKGSTFEGLDLISELLRPSNEITAKPKVEEVEEDGDDFYCEQRVLDMTNSDELVGQGCGYGFAWQRAGVLEKLQEEIGALVDVDLHELGAIEERVQMCEEFDRDYFDGDRYLADTLDAEEYLEEATRRRFECVTTLTTQDREFLKDLPSKRSYKFSDELNAWISFSLVDIVFAYAYERRVNDDELSCEAGWTCAKLAPSLSFLCRWTCVHEALVACIRRSLCYPMFRSWELAQRVVDDTMRIISGGKCAILHVLCQVHKIFGSSGDFRYLFNELFIKEYCLWIQSVDVRFVDSLVHLLGEMTKIQKSDVKLDLELLEAEASLQQVNLTGADSDDEPDV